MFTIIWYKNTCSEVWLPQTTTYQDAGLVTEVLYNVKVSCGLAQPSCLPCTDRIAYKHFLN